MPLALRQRSGLRSKANTLFSGLDETAVPLGERRDDGRTTDAAALRTELFNRI
jgi:hypothetical protein